MWHRTQPICIAVHLQNTYSLGMCTQPTIPMCMYVKERQSKSYTENFPLNSLCNIFDNRISRNYIRPPYHRLHGQQNVPDNRDEYG